MPFIFIPFIGLVNNFKRKNIKPSFNIMTMILLFEIIANEPNPLII